ncbi:glycerophosphodiester phosphodiesterase [bacterium]|nr:glycerophosphodiester phosphodiesterase [bacterium]
MPPFVYPSLPNIIAHRCNSLAAVDQVLAAITDPEQVYIECDVRMSQDNILVVHHEKRHQGQTISKTLFAEFRGQLLTLEAWLAYVTTLSVHIHLDVKAQLSKGKWIATADSALLYELLAANQLEERVIVTTVAGKFLKALRNISDKLRLGVLYNQDYGMLMPTSKKAVNGFINKILEFNNEIGLEAIFLNQRWLQVFDKQYKVLDTFFYAIHKAGIKIAVWTVNDQHWARRLAEQGVEWITTDGTFRAKDIQRAKSQ